MPSFFKSVEGDVALDCLGAIASYVRNLQPRKEQAPPQIPVGQRYGNPQAFQTISGN